MKKSPIILIPLLYLLFLFCSNNEILPTTGPSVSSGDLIPYMPTTPRNESRAVDTSVVLSWTGRSGVTYTVLLDTILPPVRVLASNTEATSLTVGSLLHNQTYFWQLIGNNQEGSDTGWVWHFTTQFKRSELNANVRSLFTGTGFSLMNDANDAIWVGGRSSKLRILKDDAWHTFSEYTGRKSGGSDSGNVLLRSLPNGNRWASTQSGLFEIVADPKDSVFSRSGIVSSPRDLNSVALSPDSGVWFGTPTAAVHYRNGKKVTYQKELKALNCIVASPKISSILNVWAGTESGLMQLQSKMTQRIDTTFLPFDSVAALPVRDTKIDSISRTDSIFKVGKIDTLRRFVLAPDSTIDTILTFDTTFAFVRARRIALKYYLRDLDTTQIADTIWAVKTIPLGDTRGITALFSDNQDNVWVGTSSGRLYKYSGGNDWTDYSQNIERVPVSRITQSSSSTFWFALDGGGVYRLSNTTWTRFGTDNSSLPSEFIKDIAVTSTGLAVVASDQGIFVMQPR